MTIYCSHCKEKIQSLAIVEKDRMAEVATLASLHLHTRHKKETRRLTENIAKLHIMLCSWMVFDEFDIPEQETALVKEMDKVVSEYLEAFGLTENGEVVDVEKTEENVKEEKKLIIPN